ncbi:DMT family transporter [Nitratireductor thuwali]|uniref:EamA domain-containing protein n=1 Tax=Nitratireductor thuwali TaxID=2267699 RepID=A0ABY5MMJ3_9HYPH|nr:hypothetical protein NTH_02846 [Nitratireductor thuwali]
MTTSEPKSAHAGMSLWALIVGLSFPAVGLLSEGLPPLFLTAIRFAIAAIAIGVLVWRAPDRRPGLPGLALYAVMGLCLAGFFGAMFWAAHQVSALSMATLYVSVPLLAYALGRILGVERPDVALLVTLAVGAAGALALAWVGSDGVGDSFEFGLAEGLFFLGCVASALYPVLSKWGLQRGWLSNSAALRTFWSLVAGGVLIGFLGLALEPIPALTRMTVFDFLLVAYLGVFSSGVTFWLIQRGTGVLTPGTVTAYTYLVPFVSMLILFVTEPDTIGWEWLPGSLAVILAIVLLLRRSASGRSGAPATDSRPTTG